MPEHPDDRLARIEARAKVIWWRRRLGAGAVAAALILTALPALAALGEGEGTIRVAEPSSTTAPPAGLRVSLVAEPPVVVVGEPVEVTATVEDDAAGFARFAWGWEDGDPLRFDVEVGGCEGAAPRSGPYRTVTSQRHVYDVAPATYEVRVRVHSVGCGVPGEEVTATVTIEVVAPG